MFDPKLRLMGWTAYYQVLRDQPLTDAEIGQLAELVRSQSKLPWDSEQFRINVARGARPDRVIAEGRTKMAMDTESGDSQRLATAITALSRLIGGELRVIDDFGTFGWDPEIGCVVGGGSKTAKLVDVPYGELVNALELVPAPASTVDIDALDLVGLVSLLGELDDQDALREQVMARLTNSDEREVAVAIYTRYATLGRNYHARHALDRALERLPDPRVVAGEFLAVWRQPQGTYHYGDMPLPERMRAVIASVPEVMEQLVADISATDGAGDADLPYRRAEAALNLIAGEPSGRGLRAMLEIIRARRGRKLSWRAESYVFDHAHRALGEHAEVRAVPTLLHYLGTMKKFSGPHDHALRGLVRVAPERVRPHVLALAASGGYGELMIELLVALGGDDTTAALHKLAQHPKSHVRDRAVSALRARGVEPAAYVERSLEELAIDGDQQIRHDAQRALAERKDPKTFVSLVAAEALDKYLRARTDYPGLPFSWWEWKGIVPDSVIQDTTAKKLAWASNVGRNVLGEQVTWPSVKRILEVGPGKVAEAYPSQLLAFDRETLAALEAEETEILARLG